MFSSIPPVTRTLIFVCVGMYFLQGGGDAMIAYFALWPIGSGIIGHPPFEPWQLVTYSLLHGSLTHLGFNMFALYMFGSDLERLFGTRRYVNLYLASVISAALLQLVVASLSSTVYPTVGASGGIFGLLLAFAMYFPERTVVLLIPPIPMPARIFVIVYGALELFLGVTGSQAGVAHFAHLGGMLGAWLTIRFWRGSRRR